MTLSTDNAIFFSIIVPVYNVEKYIINCLTSIKDQDDVRFEVIIVNDGSTDSSLQLISDFVDYHGVSYQVVNQKNGGLSSARNTGLSYAQGSHILFLDSDDSLAKGALSYIHSLLSTYSTVDIVSFDRNFVTEEGSLLAQSFVQHDFSEEFKIISGDQIVLDVLRYTNMSVTAIDKIFRRDFLDKFSPEVFMPGVNFEDHIFTFRSVHDVSSVLITKKKLLNYLVRNSSIMRTANEKMSTDYNIMIHLFFIKMNAFNRDSVLYHEYRQHLLIQVVSFYKALNGIRNISSKQFRSLSRHYKEGLKRNGILSALVPVAFPMRRKIIVFFIRSLFSNFKTFNSLFFMMLSKLGRG